MNPKAWIFDVGALIAYPGELSVWQRGAWHAAWKTSRGVYACGEGTSEEAALSALAEELYRAALEDRRWCLRHGDSVRAEQIRACMVRGGRVVDFGEVG